MNANTVLYIDVICSEGHVPFNKIYINKLLSAGYEVKLILKKNYVKKLNLPNSMILFELPSFLFYDFKRIGIMNRLLMLLSLIYINLRIFSNRFKDIYIGGYEEISFFFSFFLKKTILINHNNVAGLSSNVKRFFFKQNSRKHKLLVFNENIKDYLMKMKVRNIIVNPHGLPEKFQNPENISNYNSFDKIIFLPSSNSSDLQIITELINNNSFLNFLKENNIVFIIKGSFVIENANIKIIDGFLDYKDYKGLFIESDIILLPYPVSFKYRVSGIFHECLANNKICLLSRIESFDIYKDYFTYDPFFKNTDELMNRITFLINTNAFSKSDNYKDLDKLEPNFEMFKA